MKFGLEAEKFLYDKKDGTPSESVFSILDALSDYERVLGGPTAAQRMTNEFVLNMIEFGTPPSERPMEVLRDYLLSYLTTRDLAAREQVALLPLAALPIDYLPHMTMKRAYYIQNSILSGERRQDWILDMTSPLRSAGNCAGVHVHGEIETPAEYLYSNDELKDKFNLGLMVTPMIAFSSSPYFFGRHLGRSMRGLRYFEDLYRKFPLNGGLPPVMDSSMEVLEFSRASGEIWIEEGVKLGFSRDEMELQVRKKSANWNPVRWNGRWNTIEVRCLDSDFIALDAAKFVWISAAFRRMDLRGEALKTRILDPKLSLDRGMIEECFSVSGGEVAILPTQALGEIFHRAMVFGTKDELVELFLHRLGEFAAKALIPGERWLHRKLRDVLNHHDTTSEWLLSRAGNKEELTIAEAQGLITEAIEEAEERLEELRTKAPEVFHHFEPSHLPGEYHV